MKKQKSATTNKSDRRAFLRNGMLAAGAATVGGALLTNALPAKAAPEDAGISDGDAAILSFLAAAEIIETDLWQQYAELGGTQDSELPGLTGGSQPYITALQQLDQDMPQYIHDNTEDEMTHELFINAFLASKGRAEVSLDQFRILDSSKATGAQQIGRITNLMQLTVDTTWWGRYRSRDRNPDLDPTFKFAAAVPDLAKGQHPAIPRDDNDLTPQNHIQAIANTAGFHFAFIEQGGSSLYPQLAQRVTHVEVLRILLSIGGTEICHFQTWHDKAGNAVALTDPKDPTLTFPDFGKFDGNEDLQANLIMPEPTKFLRKTGLPVCSIIRPTETRGAAMAAANSFITDGLLINQIPAFFEFFRDLAADADRARRGV